MRFKRSEGLTPSEKVLADRLHMANAALRVLRDRVRVAEAALERVALEDRGRELERSPNRFLQIGLTFDDVLPRRRKRVFKVSHEHFRARIERVDEHLAIDRTGDFDAAVLEVGRRSADLPVG